MNKLNFSLLALILAFFLTSCGDDNSGDGVGAMDIEFDNIAVVNDIQRQLTLVTPGSDDYNYTNGLNQDFNINLLRYYISNIILEGPNGEFFEDEVHVDLDHAHGIYLIDESDLSTGLIRLENIPEGEYNKITFMVGVDEANVQEGAAGGVLDPATCNMFWNWNSGYVALIFEGQSAVSAGGASGQTVITGNTDGLAFHVGGWRDIEGTAFVNNNQTLSYTFDTNAKVKEGELPEVHMVFDVLKMFEGQNLIDFTGNNNVHKPTDGTPIAENLAGAFAFDHIHQ